MTFPGRCYHCGDDCTSHDIRFEEKHFCCEGCKTVYSILSQHQLCQYYSIETDDERGKSSTGQKAPGSSASRKETRFDFLDHPDIVTQLLEFSNESTATITFYIPTIHCSSCLWLLEHLYRIPPGIQQSRVNFLSKQVHLTYQPDKLTLRQVVELLGSIGCEPLISMRSDGSGDVVDKQQKTSYRPLLYRLAVAGFCAANIMLFSFPEYLGWMMHRSGACSGCSISGWRFRWFFTPRRAISHPSGSLKKGVINIDGPVLLGILVAFFGVLQAQGHRVLMIGDGLNDAGALKQADTGIAITDDTIQFTPASDAIPEASSLVQLPDMLRCCRFGMRLIWVSFCTISWVCPTP